MVNVFIVINNQGKTIQTSNFSFGGGNSMSFLKGEKWKKKVSYKSLRRNGRQSPNMRDFLAILPKIFNSRHTRLDSYISKAKQFC